MFYQEALPKFLFLSRVDSLPTIRDRHWRNVVATFEKAESVNSPHLYGTGAFSCGVPILTRCGCCNQNGCLYSWGAYFVWALIITILRYPRSCKMMFPISYIVYSVNYFTCLPIT